MNSKKEKGKLPKDWLDQINNSGKLFEQQVALELQKSGFGLVIPNYSFLDIDQEESRELDVFAITARKIGRKNNFIFPILLVSVKAMPLVCFTRHENIKNYIAGDISFTGTPKNVFIRGEETDLIEFLNFSKQYHFYKYKRVSTQFLSPLSKDKQTEYFNKGLIIPLVKALIAEEKDHEKGWEFDPDGEPINLQFYYPIIIVKELWDYNVLPEEKFECSKVHRLGFLAHYCTTEKTYDVHIDICDMKGAQGLLKIINDETEYIFDKVKNNIKILEKSAFTEAQRKIAKANSKK